MDLRKKNSFYYITKVTERQESILASRPPQAIEQMQNVQFLPLGSITSLIYEIYNCRESKENQPLSECVNGVLGDNFYPLHLLDLFKFTYGQKGFILPARLSGITYKINRYLSYIRACEKYDSLYNLQKLMNFASQLSDKVHIGQRIFTNDSCHLAHKNDPNYILTPNDVLLILADQEFAKDVYMEERKEYFSTTLPYEKSFTYYEISTISDLLLASLYEIIQRKRFFKKCENCGKYFVPLKRADEKYCNIPKTSDYKFQTCKQQANKQKKDARESTKCEKEHKSIRTVLANRRNGRKLSSEEETKRENVYDNFLDLTYKYRKILNADIRFDTIFTSKSYSEWMKEYHLNRDDEEFLAKLENIVNFEYEKFEKYSAQIIDDRNTNRKTFRKKAGRPRRQYPYD